MSGESAQCTPHKPVTCRLPARKTDALSGNAIENHSREYHDIDSPVLLYKLYLLVFPSKRRS